ncbi:hypothetical protein J3R30DRAFT_3466576 [Lentinula aciculospora]|uniref:DUF6534 domain-containing protein n=1 Tax=Lentinula aciculospora TaxID=153920 RepID=A0A9W9AGB2_9AGAR|nr:hypothetical protein J3R30DRAFT_3466576 [Lentinula aciculospora]
MENEQLAVQSLFGPIFIGAFLNGILYGVLAVQTYFYYQNSSRDAWWIKYLVFFVLIAETISFVLDFAVVWEPLIQDYGSPTIFQTTPTTFSADPLVTAAISTAVQLFQGWRIHKLTKSKIVFGSIALIAFASLAAGFTTTILIALHPAWSQLQMFEFGFLAWLISSALCDIVIAVSLSWFVLHNKTSFTSTNSILNRIMLLTLQTGTLTAVAAIADVFTFTLSEDKTLEFVWAYSLSKLYSNSLLSMLNARVEWNKVLDTPSIQTQSDVTFFQVEVLHNTENPAMRYDAPEQKPATVVYPPF